MPEPTQVLKFIDAAKAVGVGIAVGATAAIVVAAARNRRPTDDIVARNLIFPHDLERFNLSMRFDFLQYKRRSMFQQPFLNPIGRIRLPVPKQLRDAYKMNWDQVSNGPIIGAALENSLELAQSPGTTSLGEAAGGAAEGVAIATAQKAAAAAGITDLNQILQPTGMAINPFLTVLFKQPSFKSHSFSWSLVPRSAPEAETLNGILRSFQYHLLPDVAAKTGGTLLNYPDIVWPRFFGDDSFLYTFKPCVISSFDVDFSPNGASFFKGRYNVPSQVDISMQLLEIEYWTKVDFANRYDQASTAATSLSTRAF